MQTATDVQTAMRNLTNETLAAVWMQTEQQPMTAELALTRQWLMDELEQRMGDRYDLWLFADSDELTNPLFFLDDALFAAN